MNDLIEQFEKQIEKQETELNKLCMNYGSSFDIALCYCTIIQLQQEIIGQLKDQVKLLEFNKFRVEDCNGQQGWCLSFNDHFEIFWDDGEYFDNVADLSYIDVVKLGH